MTEAQSKRTRLKVARDVLISLGGTPSFNDTLNGVLRKIAIRAGVSIECCNTVTIRRLLAMLLELYGDATGWNSPQYVLERKLAIQMGATIPCCRLPPIQALFPDTVTPPEAFVFGDPDADWSFGDPDTGDEFGRPST